MSTWDTAVAKIAVGSVIAAMDASIKADSRLLDFDGLIYPLSGTRKVECGIS